MDEKVTIPLTYPLPPSQWIPSRRDETGRQLWTSIQWTPATYAAADAERVKTVWRSA